MNLTKEKTEALENFRLNLHDATLEKTSSDYWKEYTSTLENFVRRAVLAKNETERAYAFRLIRTLFGMTQDPEITDRPDWKAYKQHFERISAE